MKKEHNPETFTPAPTKTTPNRSSDTTHNFDDCVKFFNEQGKEQFGEHFVIYPEDYEIIYKLLIFAIKDVENALKYKIDLHKGVLLSGPVGCGKTTLMTMLNKYIHKSDCHIMKSCRDVSFEFIKDGYETIHKYSKNSFAKKGNEPLPRIYCFDDLGSENNLKYYGNECNVMAEILLSRYELYVQKDMITHITTNLSATEIENMYGNRVRSRMREMFNLISFSSDCMDKRK